MGRKEVKEIKKRLKAEKAEAKAKPDGENKENEKNRKPKYGFLSCVGYMIGFIWHTDKKLAVFAIALIPVSFVMAALGLFVPPKIIEVIGGGGDFSYIALVIFGVLTVTGFFTVVVSLLRTFNGHSKQVMQEKMSYMLNEKEWNLDYFYWLDPECQKKMNRAWSAWGGLDFFNNFADIVINLLNFLLYSAVISTLHPVIIIVLIARSVINFLMGLWSNKKNYEIRDKVQLANKKVNYLAYSVGQDLSYGKDIRLYSLADYLHAIGLGFSEAGSGLGFRFRAVNGRQRPVERNATVFAHQKRTVENVGILVERLDDPRPYGFVFLADPARAAAESLVHCETHFVLAAEISHGADFVFGPGADEQHVQVTEFFLRHGPRRRFGVLRLAHTANLHKLRLYGKRSTKHNRQNQPLLHLTTLLSCLRDRFLSLGRIISSQQHRCQWLHSPYFFSCRLKQKQIISPSGTDRHLPLQTCVWFCRLHIRPRHHPTQPLPAQSP